jgi:uroporphyrin-III C-methyltransferase/precorrin-2 dehydrogenase/sirohydrochlorin ferrochelatase
LDAASAYPLNVNLTGRRVLVVGGGPVAARRAAAAARAGGVVHVVAPDGCEDLWELAADGEITWHRREYSPGDLDGAWLAHTATGDRAVDAAVAAAAEAARIWCVHAGDAAAATAWTPAVARAADVTVAVSGGGDPRRARAVRDTVQLLLDSGDLPLRRHRPPSNGIGWVALVGGGPGHPGLITVRGRQLLAEADVVVVDRLAPRALLATLSDDVIVVEAGKERERHALPQSDINELLVSNALAGRRVVRLKGGDPFVLGRGGEEVLACRAANIPVEVVPGVTSAVAVPAAAGIPVTHRGVSRQVVIASGHDELDWPALAALGGTLVLLMAVARLEQAARALMAHGRPAHTPVAVVESGFAPDQRTTLGTLGTIAAQADDVGVRPPAVVVVGDVVDLAAILGTATPLISSVQ